MNVVHVVVLHSAYVDEDGEYVADSGELVPHAFATADLLEEYITKMDPRVRCDSFISPVVT